MNPNAVAEAHPVIGTIDPQTVTSTPVVGDYIPIAKYHKLLFTFMLGNMAAETIDCAVYKYTDGSGSGGTVEKAAAQLAAHASNNDNKQIVIEIDCSKIDASTYTHVAARMVTGDATGGPAACLVQGVVNRYDPGTDGDLATVVEIARN